MEYTLLLIILIFLYGIFYLYRIYTHFEKLGIPYVKPWPIFGNMGKVSFKLQSFFDNIDYIYNYNRDAKYIGMYNFLTPLILIRDLEVIKGITVTNYESFINHANFGDKESDIIAKHNLFLMENKQWKELRAVLNPVYNTIKMKTAYEMMLPIIENYMNFIHDLPAEKKNLLDSKDLFSRLSNDIGAKHDFGIDIDSLKYPDNEFYVRSRRKTNVETNFSLKLILFRGLPWLIEFLGFKVYDDNTMDFYKQIMETTIKTREEQGISRPDLIQFMLEARDKCRTVELDLTNMTVQSFIFFVGSIENVSAQVCLLLHELALNPEVQCRLQKEIDEAKFQCNEISKITHETISAMPYLDAVFQEVNRVHPIPVFLDRVCNNNYELPPALPGLKPHTLKPGDIVWIPVPGIHYDPKYFDKPDKFDPARYFRKKVTFNDPMNLGFGIGPRYCIGAKFAILQAKVIIFHLLSKFNIKKSVKTDDPFVISPRTLSPVPRSGFWIKIEERSLIEDN